LLAHPLFARVGFLRAAKAASWSRGAPEVEEHVRWVEEEL